MCLVIMKPEGVTLPEGLLRTAFARNNDGWGLMRMGRKGPYIRRGVRGFDEFLANYRQYERHACGIHFRACSSGPVNVENTHPFQIGEHTFVMHNGHFNNVVIFNKERSDTWHFAHTLSRFEESLFKPKFFNNLEKITANQRLLFMSPDLEETFAVANSHLWYEDPETGSLFSNHYSFDPTREFLIHNYSEEAVLAWEERERKKKEQEKAKKELGPVRDGSKEGLHYTTPQEYVDFWTRELQERQIEANLQSDLKDAARFFYPQSENAYDKETDMAGRDNPIQSTLDERESEEELSQQIEIDNMGKDELRDIFSASPSVAALATFRTIQRL